LYTDARSGFLTGPDELAKKPAKANEPEAKAHVHIKTNGRFVFDLAKDTARFDAPLRPALAHDRVTVTRYVAAKPPKSGIVTDLLDCDRLDLQFRKKSGDSPGSNDKDIEFAIATAKPQAIVELHLEGEEMHATGVEMHYFAPTAKVGPRTIIKGAPMHAMRQGNQIHCDELHLKGADKQGNGQEAYAKGPGKIDLLDKKTGRSTTHVLFKTSFTATKDREGERLFELLTLRGDASFIDEENKHEIHAAQFLHVWLEDLKPDPKVDPKADPKADPKKSEGGQKSRPHKLEAFEKVQVRSPELNIRDANHLNVVFVEQKIIPVAKSFEGVAVLPAIAASGPAKTTETGFKKDPAEPALPNIAVPNPTVAVAKEKPKRPLEVTGTKISVQIATMGNVKELLEFLADGNVHITQEAENPKDKGLEIIGSTVSLTRKFGGDTLQVFGEPRKLAQLQQNEMLLFGPKVTIDQVKNLAEVEGTGAMHMPSNTTLDGKKKNGHITIHWNKSMVFDGKFAEFVGGVEAFQDNGKILCQEMQVTMDKPVVFKKTNGNQTAKIDRIICNGREDRKVLILEEDRDAKNALQMYRRLLLAVVEVDNIEQKMNGSGPGVLDFISRSSASDPGLAGGEKPKGAEPAKKDDEKILKWTRVRFEGQMLSYPTATGGRQTTFLEQVRVYHQPGDDPNVRDPSEVGPGGLFFTCQRLTIIQRKVGNKNSQEMIADGMNGMVNFQAKEFHGNAKMVKYDESQEQIIFEGVPGAPATLFKMPKIIGDRPQRIQGSKILYNRKTGEFLLDGVTVISSWLFIEDKPAVDLACGEPRFGIARFERCDS
ncbi:MAG: LptA/OstA family protein, partial [Planctomycetota bacterium]